MTAPVAPRRRSWAEPYKIKMVELLKTTTLEERQRAIVAAGYNTFLLRAEDVFVDLVDGQPVQRDSLLGQVHNLLDTTVVVEFNDLTALNAALAGDDVACVLAEPVMTRRCPLSGWVRHSSWW